MNLNAGLGRTVYVLCYFLFCISVDYVPVVLKTLGGLEPLANLA